jgi:hypothetical protein
MEATKPSDYEFFCVSKNIPLIQNNLKNLKHLSDKIHMRFQRYEKDGKIIKELVLIYKDNGIECNITLENSFFDLIHVSK